MFVIVDVVFVVNTKIVVVNIKALTSLPQHTCIHTHTSLIFLRKKDKRKKIPQNLF